MDLFRRNFMKLAYVLICLMILSPLLKARETDQFILASHLLKDSSTALNDYIEDKFNQALIKINSSVKFPSCFQVADKVLSEIVGQNSFSQISHFADTSFLVDRYPDLTINNKDYIQASIYEQAGLPFPLVQLARTINVGGVYIGSDKLGHFALVGRNYFRRNLRNRSLGMNPLEAEKATVQTGINEEFLVLGYALDGVFSFADLEANYQGMLFGLSMCEGKHPYLVRSNKKWIRNMNREFNIRHYLNPKMDESYNPSFWKMHLWNKINPKIKILYCELKQNPIFIERKKYYDMVVLKNRNDQYIKDFLENCPFIEPELESIDRLCI